MGHGIFRRAVGGEAVIQPYDGAVGHHIARHAALDVHGLQALAELAPVDGHAARLVVGHPRQHLAQAMNGVAAEPGASGVGPLASDAHLDPHRALAARLDASAGGLGEDGRVARHEVGALGEEAVDPVEARVDLLTLVEDVGHVDRGRAHRASELGQHGHARLHVARAQPVHHIAVDACPVVAVHRHGVGVAGQHQTLRPPESRAGHHVVSHPVDLEPWHRPQQLLEVVGDGALVMADRRDVDKLGGEREQIGHVATPCSRSTSLRCSRSPG